MALPAMASAHGNVRQHDTMRMLEQGAFGSVVSGNWSGYAVTGPEDSVTEAAGSWVVPTATCAGNGEANTGASFWVGIDGYTSPTVEQTGTDSDCSKGAPTYYAWYEFAPLGGVTITTIDVEPGDVMTASVTYDGTEFTLTISDERTNQTFTISKEFPMAKRDSAEWIAEDNSFVFTDFGTVAFGEDGTGVTATCEATVSGETKPIGGFHTYHAIFLGGLTKYNWFAVPSALTPDGTSFTVQWH